METEAEIYYSLSKKEQLEIIEAYLFLEANLTKKENAYI